MMQMSVFCTMAQVCDGESRTCHAGKAIRPSGFSGHWRALDAATGVFPEA